MAKKQTRRSISVSRGTYERLKAFCETNGVSMSQFVERRVGDYLGFEPQGPRRAAPRPATIPAAPQAAPTPAPPAREPVASAPVKTDTKAPTERSAEQIFTF